MALAFKPKFTLNDVKKIVDERIGRIELAIINRLRFTGESFVKNARENANFKDRTGNLRSSIGYVILKNGEEVNANFRGGLGRNEGLKVALEVAANFPKGFVLIVVAGMEYAAAVESKNFDVLTSSSLIAEAELKAAIKELNSKIGKMK